MRTVLTVLAVAVAIANMSDARRPIHSPLKAMKAAMSSGIATGSGINAVIMMGRIC
ncbi:MAG TPA: hypothetical protein VKV39_05615 [Candidatus Sulfotelmatobacter sp.]|nr:hypothetical protein [Candidatus Sulfotelmatobacter sp.]